MQINKNILGKHQYVLPYTSNYRYKLDVIENFWPAHPDVKTAISSALDGKIHQYPYHDDIYYELLNRISSYTETNASNIILTNGSDTALKIILEGYVTPESNTLIITPTYPHFISFIENLYHADIDYLNINLTDSDDVITDKIIKELSNKSYNLCYICNPNLPLGYVLNHNYLTKLLSENPKTMFVIDEAYYEYPIPGTVVPSASLLIKDYDNVCVTRTFSKAFGLAGLRIGYILSNQKTIDILRVLSNDKNVISASIYAANATLKNLDYYQKCSQEVQYLKQQVANELSEIVSDDDEIFDYNVKGGNFFLIFAKNPEKVVKIFREHRIYIRNKHDDVPYAIRITMGTAKMMDDVLLLCKFINIKSQLAKYRVVFDLDMTLRNGSKLSSPAISGINILNNLSYTICTSNGSQSIKEIYNWFINNGINIEFSQIINPVAMVYKYLMLKDYKNILIVAPKNVSDELSMFLPHLNIKNVFDDNVNKLFDIVIYTGSPALNTDQLALVCESLSNKAVLAYTDQGLTCDLTNSADTDKTGSAIIPDIGSYMSMFKSIGYESINIGKPVFLEYCDLSDVKYVVGDSIRSDGAVAKALSAVFVLVDQKCIQPYVDFDNKRIVINSVYDLN